MLKQYPNLRLFCFYIVIAAVATVVDLAVLYFFTEFLGFWYFWVAVFGYLAGMVTNFSLNKYFNFRNYDQRIIRQFSLFASVALLGLLLNQIVIYSLVEFLGLWYILAKLLAVIVVFFWSFYGHKNITFRLT